MTIPAGIIFAWPSTAASIPSGWTRETGLDGKYIRGAAAGADADLVSSFGSATHNHTEAGHTPTQNAHTHTFSAGAASGNVRRQATVSDAVASTSNHTHGNATSASTTATNQSATSVLTAFTNDLQYGVVIFIKSDGSAAAFPSGIYAFFLSDSLPASWTRVLGNSYLKGAAAAGDGGATGGSNTHSHTENGSHTHVQDVHTHASTFSAIPSASTFPDLGDGSGTDPNNSHLHNITFGNTTATNNSTSLTTDTQNHEPPFLKINIIRNDGGLNWPANIVGLWGGTNANIPADWARVTDYDGNFLKGANADGESDSASGGSTTHSHTASCQPTQSAHTHTGSGANPGAGSVTGAILRSGGVLDAILAHTHTWTVANTTATNQAATVSYGANSAESAYPPYGKVIVIKFTGTPPVISSVPMRTMTKVGL